MSRTVVSKVDDAKLFLEAALEDGPVHVKVVLAMAKELGHSQRTIETAKRRLKVISIREKKLHARCFWILPPS